MNRLMPTGLALVAAVGLAVAALAQHGANDGAPRVVSMRIDGAISPAAAAHLEQGIAAAVEQKAEALIVGLDTPGGLDTSTRAMVEDILDADVPIIMWVSPSGARAASAGTFLVYASHIAAMAPATSVGAATPIELAPSTPRAPSTPGAPADERAPAPADVKDDSRNKAINDAVSALRGLAELRDRDAQFAEAAVREGASLPSHEALERGVIDVVARDQTSLLTALHGKRVDVNGVERTLALREAVVIELEPDWRTKIFSVLGNPNVAYLLLILGFYALLFELSSPGGVVPGVLGAIALLIALFSLHLLPVSFVGVALLVLGAALLIAEVFTPTFGALGFGGVVAALIGSFFLIDTDLPAFRISRGLIIAVGALGAIFVFVVLRLALRQRRRPVTTGREQLVGATAEVTDGFEHRGTVQVFGERWNAESDTPVAAGEHVDIIGIDGLILRVRPHGASS